VADTELCSSAWLSRQVVWKWDSCVSQVTQDTHTGGGGGQIWSHDEATVSKNTDKTIIMSSLTRSVVITKDTQCTVCVM